MSSYYKAGSWNAVCDRCGFEFKAEELRKDWQGLMVCREDWEPRHEQDFIRTRTEKLVPPWTRPETATDSEQVVCYLWENSSYADLATADCATADTTTQTYAFLLALKNGTG
jgi:hypothetical protein